MNITKYDNVIDSRDVIEALKEMEAELQDYYENSESPFSFDEWLELEDDLNVKADIGEYKALREFADECEQCSVDWEHSESLIRYSYFTDYVREMLEDCGYIPDNLPWYINNAIDWDKVSDAISQDYSEVDWDDVSFYIRNS